MQTSKTSTRKPHPKSRNGCSQCRKSRIKCDEQAPCCNHCNRRGLQCDFEDEKTRFKVLTPPGGRSQHTMQTKPKAPTHISVAVAHHDLAPVTSFEQPWVWAPFPAILDSMKTQIFHHFVTETAITLSSKDIPHGFWHNDVPRLALQNEYLLNAVFAVSALHRSHLQHTNNLVPTDVNRSIAWHRRSVELFSTTIVDITAENCIPAMAMAGISALYSCGVAQLMSSLQGQEHIDQFVDIILAVHKALQLFQPFAPFLNTKGVLLPTQTLVAAGMQDTQTLPISLPNAANTAEKLQAMVSSSNLNAYEKRIFEEAITACRVSARGNWMGMVSTEFLSLLQAKKPMAILILTAFSMIDDGFEVIPWYFSLWNNRIWMYFKEFLGPLWTQYLSMWEFSGDFSSQDT